MEVAALLVSLSHGNIALSYVLHDYTPVKNTWLRSWGHPNIGEDDPDCLFFEYLKLAILRQLPKRADGTCRCQR